MKPARATSIRFASDDTRLADDVRDILRRVAETDPLLRLALDRRCARGLDCQRTCFDPPKRCDHCRGFA